MKILHLSDRGLPDWRIEKSAISALNVGYQVMFAGERPKHFGQAWIFSRLYQIDWSPRARRGFPIYWQAIKKQVKRVLDEAQPDIVHAHDIFAAKMISEFKVPFVYDNHEYWTVYVKRQAESMKLAHFQSSQNKTFKERIRSYVRNLLMQYAIYLWTKWEQELVASNITITVSDRIAKELRTISGNSQVLVVPNFPSLSEVKDFEKPHPLTALSSVYAGLEATGNIMPAHRNIKGLVDVFNSSNIGPLYIIGLEGISSEKVKYKGFLPRAEMYREMFNHSIGLLPWKKHWSHYFVNPNKVYEYAHAGLFVLCTSSFETVSETLKSNCITFDNYEELVLRLKYFKEHRDELFTKRLAIFNFARSNLIWEKYEKNIFDAYGMC